MTPTQPEPKASRRGLWLVVVVVASLLALSTWDILRNSGGNSPIALRRAAFDGDEATVRRLLAAHPEWIDTPGSTNASKRATGGLLEVTLIALGKPAPSPTSPEGEREEQFWALETSGATPLIHAAARRHLGAARLLVDAGANLQGKVARGWPLSALTHHAAGIGDTNFLTALETRGVRLQSDGAGYETWLMGAAVEGGHPDMLQFLIGRGLSVNERHPTRITPLHLAAAKSRLDLVQMLATNGADLTVVSFFDETALDIARKFAPSSSNATAIVTWLEAFAATNQPPAKPVP